MLHTCSLFFWTDLEAGEKKEARKEKDRECERMCGGGGGKTEVDKQMEKRVQRWRTK